MKVEGVKVTATRVPQPNVTPMQALSLPVTAVALGEPWPVDGFAGVAALAVLVLHRANIARLRAGTETRFRFRRRVIRDGV